jgi:dTDP-4-dehydrorhamnose reductase
MAVGPTILVIGRNGQLARELAACSWSGAVNPVFLGRNDICLASTLTARRQITALGPAAIINTAAFSRVDAAEAAADACWELNARLPARLAGIAGSLDVPLLHVSTDYVFAGDATAPYDETAPAKPLSTYGFAKEAGERAVVASAGRALVVRSAWLFGIHGDNVLTRILARCHQLSGATLHMVDDQIGSPTPAAALAGLLQALALELIGNRRPLPRLLHFAGQPQSSWHGFAEAVLDAWSHAGHFALRPALAAIPASAYPTPARRPAFSALDCRAAAALGYPPPDWRAALNRLAGIWAERRAA